MRPLPDSLPASCMRSARASSAAGRAGTLSRVRAPTLPDLPIQDALPELRAALATHASAVLEAPPGAGKSTVVPLALLEAAWLGNERIVMLEPRRVAARAVATRMATTLDESVGETVGYRTRTDTRVGPRTRIEVVTEGILTRRLQRDPTLEGVGCVIFDEFHERSLHADLGLALALDVQAQLRETLRILVMSATLDGEAISRLLGRAPLIRSEGRLFTVETVYTGPAPSRSDDRLEPANRRGDRARIGRARGRRARLPAGRGRDPPHGGAARGNLAGRGGAASGRCTASSGQRCRTRRFGPSPTDGAGSCSRPTSPRPASRSRVYASSSTAATSDDRASTRHPA